jgi:two-component system LytT family sensor kinase
VLSSIGWLFSLPGLSGDHWRQTFVGSLAQWWSWGLVTPVIFWADRHLPFSDKQLAPPILAHLLPSVFLTATYIYVFAAVRALLGMGSWSALLDTRILASALKGMFLWSWLVYWLIFGARQIYRYYEHYLSSELRMERLERSFSEARLNAKLLDSLVAVDAVCSEPVSGSLPAIREKYREYLSFSAAHDGVDQEKKAFTPHFVFS